MLIAADNALNDVFRASRTTLAARQLYAAVPGEGERRGLWIACTDSSTRLHADYIRRGRSILAA